MDQRVPNKRDALASLIAFVSHSVAQARAVEKPFYHLEFDRVFPDDVYAAMIDAMPKPADYRPLPGRNGGNMREDGTSTRVKIDLFPEYMRHLPEHETRRSGTWSDAPSARPRCRRRSCTRSRRA